MNKKLLIILFLLPLISKSQIVSDAKFWTGISINKKINDFEFSFSEELRFDENVSHIDKVFSELGTEYKIVRGLYVGVNYRFSRSNDYESRNYDLSHRIDLGITYQYELNKLEISFRTKIQTENEKPYKNNPTYSRNKFGIKYKLENDLTPFATFEFYYQFNDERLVNRTRFSLGSSYKLNDKSKVKFFYMYEDKFNVKNLEHNHVYGVSYSIDL